MGRLINRAKWVIDVKGKACLGASLATSEITGRHNGKLGPFCLDQKEMVIWLKQYKTNMQSQLKTFLKCVSNCHSNGQQSWFSHGIQLSDSGPKSMGYKYYALILTFF